VVDVDFDGMREGRVEEDDAHVGDVDVVVCEEGVAVEVELEGVVLEGGVVEFF